MKWYIRLKFNVAGSDVTVEHYADLENNDFLAEVFAKMVCKIMRPLIAFNIKIVLKDIGAGKIEFICPPSVKLEKFIVGKTNELRSFKRGNDYVM